MRKLLYALLLPAALILLSGISLLAQNYPFRSQQDSLQLIALIDRYLAISPAIEMPTDTVAAYATEEFARKISQNRGHPIRFPLTSSYQIEGARVVRSDGSLAIVTIPYSADSVPLFGAMTIDWVLFAVHDSLGNGWRISAARQLFGIADQVEKLAALDRSDFPESLKKVVAWERSRMLLSNEQIRRQFMASRGAFRALAGQFLRGDSLLRTMARNDHVITQLNNLSIYWGAAAEDVPREAVDEYLKKLDKKGQKEFRAQLNAVEKQRRNGYDTLARMGHQFGITPARLDSVVTQMRELGLIFATSKLPWKGTVQFTIGGYLDDVVGLIYAPLEQLPLVSPDEYFYLEDLGDGWWIFRST